MTGPRPRLDVADEDLVGLDDAFVVEVDLSASR